MPQNPAISDSFRRSERWWMPFWMVVLIISILSSRAAVGQDVPGQLPAISNAVPLSSEPLGTQQNEPELAPEIRALIEAPSAAFAGQDGALALQDGRVLFGKLTTAPGGYLIKSQQGREEMIPTFMVQTASESLEGCYQNLRKTMRNPRPEDHVTLADWCVKQGLLKEARLELSDALTLDPNRRDARLMLMAVETKTSATPRHLQSEPASTRSEEGFAVPVERTTLGLSQQTTSLFAQRIHSLVSAKCGNLGCHGGPETANFKLTRVSRANLVGRHTTIENLQNVLNHIDSNSPNNSPLLQVLGDKTHSKIFVGIGGAGQEKHLRAWVELAAADLQKYELAMGVSSAGQTASPKPVAAAEGSGAEAVPAPLTANAALASARPIMPTGLQTASAEGPQPSPVLKQQEPAPLQRMARPPALQAVEVNEPLINEVLKQEAPDPFDPNEFNRKAHPGRVP